MRATIALLALGCTQPSGILDFCDGRDDDGDGIVDEGTGAEIGCEDLQYCREGACSDRCAAATDTLDVLFVIDDTSSMAQEQPAFAVEIPTLVSRLSRLGEGTSVHFGVITGDLGVVDEVPSCTVGPGGDGILRESAECNTERIVEFTPGEHEPGTVGVDLACAAQPGTQGCGFQQPFEAALKALTDTPENGGFLRSDSTLAIVFLTDSDDCSTSDPELFTGDDAVYGPLNLRCARNGGTALYAIERYVERFLALRGDPSRLVFAAIAGVPGDLATTSAYDAALADPRMSLVEDGDILLPSCNVPGNGVSFPPRRVVELARDLRVRGAVTTVQSICSADLAGAMDAVIDAIAISTEGCR
jgi:hypothetical protein